MSSIWLFAAFLAAAPAPQVEEAKRYFEAARAAFEAGKYREAIPAFWESYQRAPRAATLYSLAQAYRLQYLVDRDPAKLKQAVELYERYVKDEQAGSRKGDAAEHLSALQPILAREEEQQRRLGKAIEAAQELRQTQLMLSARAQNAVGSIDGSDPVELPLVREVAPGPHKVRAEAPGYFPEELEGMAVAGRTVVVEVALREQPAKLALLVPDGAEVAVGGRRVGDGPFAVPLELPAGRHTVTVSQLGHYPAGREVDLFRGQTTPLDVELDITRQRIVAWGFLGGGVLAGAAGGLVSALALSAQGTAQDFAQRLDAGQNLTADDVGALGRAINRRDRLAPMAGVLFGGALAALTSGFLLYVLDQPRLPEAGVERGGPENKE